MIWLGQNGKSGALGGVRTVEGKVDAQPGDKIYVDTGTAERLAREGTAIPARQR